MIRRSRATLSSLLGLGLAAVFLAGCGAASATPAATPAGPALSPRPTLPAGSPSASASVPASGSPAPSGSASDGSPSASASDPLNLPHIDAALEANLPSRIGAVDLFKFSLTLQAYIASTPGAGEDALYLPWLVKFGKTPADVNIAIATDLTDQENFIAHAVEVPGATAAALSSGFGDAATKAGWPVKSHTNWGSTGKTVLEIIDPAAKTAGGLYDAFVYAKDDVLYTVITDDQDLLVEALIKMP